MTRRTFYAKYQSRHSKTPRPAHARYRPSLMTRALCTAELLYEYARARWEGRMLLSAIAGGRV